MTQHEKHLRTIASNICEGRIPGRASAELLLVAADYLAAHEDAFNEYRARAQIQIDLRVEAQARAGRLAREARR